MPAKAIDVPFDRDGNMLSYPQTGRFDHATGTFPDLSWHTITAFKATLAFADVTRGRSAVAFTWRDVTTGTTYPMFVSDLADLLKTITLRPTGVTATWTACKRGSNYGIRLLMPEER